MENSYHKILDVAKGASDEEIKKSLDLKYHPDKNKTPGAEEKFKEIDEAYKSLLEAQIRRREVNDKFRGISESAPLADEYYVEVDKGRASVAAPGRSSFQSSYYFCINGNNKNTVHIYINFHSITSR
ncbi:dnaJ homolog subfamily B member 1-like [Temnothorax curvispinosus]|uniref:DnaJ homolog subfamily B member 9 n=1 Tax=Temnothorax curvispinosus TaxID=300111 RepID=A0A6J1QNY0_9HYME|nr:dnaJ homolog subfamily B member 1-like [Temnothorax curvispinosus]